MAIGKEAIRLMCAAEISDAIRKLKAEQCNSDTEDAHANADDVLCDLLAKLGLSDVVLEYASVNKWYS